VHLRFAHSERVPLSGWRWSEGSRVDRGTSEKRNREGGCNENASHVFPFRSCGPQGAGPSCV